MNVYNGINFTGGDSTELEHAKEEIISKLKMADALMDEAAEVADKYGLTFDIDFACASVYYEGKDALETDDGPHSYNPEWDWDSSGLGL